MKKMRIPLLIGLGVAIFGIIMGSFFDLQISTAIASRHNMFAVTVSAIGPTIGFLGLAIPGGGFLALGLSKKYKLWANIGLFVLALICYGASVYFAGKEYFSSHGFAGAAPSIVGYLIAAVPLAGGVFLGFKLFRNTDHPYAWIILLGIVAVAFVVLVPGVTILKEIMHRPRFRTVAEYEGIDFHAWWEPCKDYKSLMQTFGLASEEFKSYPSGHTAEASLPLIFVTFMPLLNKKLEKYQLPCFIGAGAFVLLVALARILAAAHFLSDVSTALALTFLFTFIANEIVIRAKKLQPVEAEA